MLHHFLHSTPKKRANRTIYLNCIALTSILCELIFFTACSGSSFPTSNSTTSTGTSTTKLTVSSVLPPATMGSAYNTTLTVTGGVAPYAFYVASGQLPQGVLLNDSTGTLTGTPGAAGTFSFAVSVSDSTGLSQKQPLQMTVSNLPTTPTPAPPAPSPTAGSNGASSFSNLQHGGGWGQFGQGPPNFVDCSPSPCDGIAFSMTHDVASPSISGQASEYYVGGSTPFSDALWNNHLIGPGSSQGMPDTDQSLIPNLHDFTYDVYFYGDNLGLAQALEFDINQFFGNMGFIFGHECRIASGNQWDVWDNQNKRWKPTGIPCYPNNNSWNHLTIKVQRTSNNALVYQSITLNGVTSNLNWSFGAGSSNGWYGVTINYQMDGNSQQNSYKVYLDNLTFSYQ